MAAAASVAAIAAAALSREISNFVNPTTFASRIPRGCMLLWNHASCLVRSNQGNHVPEELPARVSEPSRRDSSWPSAPFASPAL